MQLETTPSLPPPATSLRRVGARGRALVDARHGDGAVARRHGDPLARPELRLEARLVRPEERQPARVRMRPDSRADVRRIGRELGLPMWCLT